MMAAMHADGKTADQIAKVTGINRATVFRDLQAIGVANATLEHLSPLDQQREEARPSLDSRGPILDSLFVNTIDSDWRFLHRESVSGLLESVSGPLAPIRTARSARPSRAGHEAAGSGEAVRRASNGLLARALTRPSSVGLCPDSLTWPNPLAEGP
jgi:hypothetical protein